MSYYVQRGIQMQVADYAFTSRSGEEHEFRIRKEAEILLDR
jgi:hypothetical protein